ncbi:MAG: hypothetical protein IPL77_12375 [Flavobacteriales bacterium]|nr:hypothetical protein [Flavobacteriales bacterium]
MATLNENSDPLSPAYPSGGPNVEPPKGKGGLAGRSNITVLVIIAVVVLAAMLYMAWEREDTAPAPEAKEIKPE